MLHETGPAESATMHVIVWVRAGLNEVSILHGVKPDSRNNCMAFLCALARAHHHVAMRQRLRQRRQRRRRREHEARPHRGR